MPPVIFLPRMFLSIGADTNLARQRAIAMLNSWAFLHRLLSEVCPVNTFFEWLGPILAVCIGVMILTVFFNALAAVKNLLSPARSGKIKGFLDEKDRVTVHLIRGEILENVRFVGLLDRASVRGGLPHQLANMVIVESESGERILLRADSIRSIRQLSADARPSANGNPGTPARTTEPRSS